MEQTRINYVDIHTHHPREGVLSPRTIGVHPWEAERVAELPDCAAAEIIGETGIDRACGVNIEAQERLFELHLKEAERLKKPVVLHVVRAFEEVMTRLAKHNIESVVFHGFVGSTEQAIRAVERGYYLSFGERSLRSPKTCKAMEQTPLERLFIETDDNAEIGIETLYERVAAMRGISVEELAAQMMENYKRVIR
jgi:TatD DNase family protein